MAEGSVEHTRLTRAWGIRPCHRLWALGGNGANDEGCGRTGQGRDSIERSVAPEPRQVHSAQDRVPLCPWGNCRCDLGAIAVMPYVMSAQNFRIEFRPGGRAFCEWRI